MTKNERIEALEKRVTALLLHRVVPLERQVAILQRRVEELEETHYGPWPVYTIPRTTCAPVVHTDYSFGAP